jgi:cobalt-zinc-cadmium efflux system membrane fusion protein
MPIHDHTPSTRGRAFLWAGVGLGLLFVAAMFTHGFGLFSGKGKTDETPAVLLRQGDKIIVPEGSPLRQRLTVEAASGEPVGAKLVLPGEVEADPARTAAVLTPLSGRVLELKVGLGDRVSRGQLLALIDSPDLGQAYDDNDKAKDAAELAQKNLDRQEGQFKLDVIAEKDLDQARSDNTQAQAEYTRTQARLKMLGGLDGEGQPSRLLRIRAPVSGSVTTLTVAAGALVNDPTQAMMTVSDLSTVWVTALAPEKDIAAVSRDQDAEVVLTAYPDHPLHGKVLFVSDVVEPDSHRNKIRIAFPNTDYALKPNMFATVTLVGPPQTRVVLPSSALLMNNDRTSVFVATAPWTFERRTVDPQLEEGAHVAIRSGVQPGEQVVVKGGILLND